VRDIVTGRIGRLGGSQPGNHRNEAGEGKYEESSEEELSEEEDHDESHEVTPPLVDDTDAMLMELHPVHTPGRTVQATITSDGDSITVTGTDITDVTASVISSSSEVGCVALHSAMNPLRMHANTRYSITGTTHQFEPKLYGKPCPSAALTRFRNLELFRVSNRSISFIVSAYILNETIPSYPCFYNDWVTTLCCAFNVARMQPSLFPSYSCLSKRRQGQYYENVSPMLPFECLKGSDKRKADIKDTVTDLPHETGLDFISVFWDVIKRWALLPAILDEDSKAELIALYQLDMMLYDGSHEAYLLLDTIPAFARLLTTNAIFSARAVGIKSAWPSKPCSVVDMNDEKAIRNVLVAHTAVIHNKAKNWITPVPESNRELIVAIDIAHQIAPTADFTSFVCMGPGLARFATAATAVTKDAETLSRSNGTNSAGESAIAVPFLLLFVVVVAAAAAAKSYLTDCLVSNLKMYLMSIVYWVGKKQHIVQQMRRVPYRIAQSLTPKAPALQILEPIHLTPKRVTLKTVQQLARQVPTTVTSRHAPMTPRQAPKKVTPKTATPSTSQRVTRNTGWTAPIY
jgi:hypothetical protein